MDNVFEHHPEDQLILPFLAKTVEEEKAAAKRRLEARSFNERQQELRFSSLISSSLEDGSRLK
jgi:hypothetical protein